jgi:hypothetical protein
VQNIFYKIKNIFTGRFICTSLLFLNNNLMAAKKKVAKKVGKKVAKKAVKKVAKKAAKKATKKRK